jgi:membrane peptidoglycan carboxypeptidase
MEKRLLAGSDPSKVIYSFTLYEQVAGSNLVRVQTDNYDQPFDINEGTKLDLGSTAKLRVLVSYLEIVASLHARLGALPPEELRKEVIARQDAIARWAVDHLRNAKDRSLRAMLEAAMERKYSASPGERFYTGGGLLGFENFDRADNARILTVREGLQRSVNLVFIRLMRDIVRHTAFNMPSSSATLLEDETDPKRREYLARFADREGREFIARFYRKYQGQAPADAEARLLQGIRPTPARLAPIFRTLEPTGSLAQFRDFLRRSLPDARIADATVSRLYEDYSTQRFDLADRGYLAGVHPLELWLVAFLRQHPGSTLAQAIEASADERQNVYHWLFKTRHKNAQDNRIRTLIEVEAFLEIHRMWKRLGYPFESVVPSYATALGSSADRPAALAELIGILVNDGVRLPTLWLDRLAFAVDTPYETRLAYRPVGGERVLPPEVAQIARVALARVVEGGSAQRLRGVFTRQDGIPLTIGGKTGTGDHRFETYGKRGALISARVVSRSGAFVFYIGERHFGVLTAYVKGADAAKYKFTSALPAQILKVLAPKLLDSIGSEAKIGTTCAIGSPSRPKA